jgi:hypothetical protein
LPELDETGGRIVAEIAFRLASEGDEVGIMGGEKPESSRPDHAAREVPQERALKVGDLRRPSNPGCLIRAIEMAVSTQEFAYEGFGLEFKQPRCNLKAWHCIFEEDPDLALLSEVNFVPDDVRGYNFCFERAMGPKCEPRHFKTCILTKGEIVAPINLTANQAWVSECLRTFSGNFVARRVQFDGGGAANVVSVHMPSWYVPYREFTDGDVSEVMLPNYGRMSMSELLWVSLDHTMAKHDGDWIVGDDFNTSEFLGPAKRQDANREVIARMQRLGFVEAVRHLNGRPVPTYKAPAPLRHQLDHLYVSGKFRSDLESANVGDPDIHCLFSDHLPVVAEITRGTRRPGL